MGNVVGTPSLLASGAIVNTNYMTYTPDYTAGSGTNRLVVAVVTYTGTRAVTGCNMGAVAMTLEVSAGTGTTSRPAIYYLKEADIPTGAQTINCQIGSDALGSTQIQIFTLAGIDQTTPEYAAPISGQANSSGSTGASLNAVNGGVVISERQVQSVSWAVPTVSGYTDTHGEQAVGGTYENRVAWKDIDATAAQDLTWTAPYWYAYVAASFAPSAAAGATLSAPTSASIAQTTATIGCTSDTAAGLVHAGVTTTATPPSDAQLIAGSGGGLVAAGSVSAAAGTNTVGLTGLTANTGYFRHFIQSDGGSATSTMLSPDATAGFTTLAAAAVIHTGTIVNVTTTGFQVRFTTNVGSGQAWYIAYPTAVADPANNATGAEQIRNGLTSEDTAAMVAGGPLAVVGTGVQTFTATTGLSPGSNLRAAVVHYTTPE